MNRRAIIIILSPVIVVAVYYLNIEPNIKFKSTQATQTHQYLPSDAGTFHKSPPNYLPEKTLSPPSFTPTRDKGFGDASTLNINNLSDMQQCTLFPIKTTTTGINCSTGCNNYLSCYQSWVAPTHKPQ